MSGPKNMYRSLKRMARSDARAAAKALKNIRSNQTAMRSSFVREQVITCQREVDFLIECLTEKCRHCGKRVEFGHNCCAACADERGP